MRVHYADDYVLAAYRRHRRLEYVETAFARVVQ